MNRIKRKLLVVLGAGSSLSCGMPSTSEIDGLMKGWGGSWSNLPTYPLGASGRGVYCDLWDMVAAYQDQNPRPHLGLRLNYEKILGEMVALASWATPSPFGNALISAVQDGRPSSAFTWPKDQDGPYFHRNMIIEQLGFLIHKLADHMRERCLAVDVSSQAFGAYCEILRRLADEFDVGVYNLNYDNLAVRALPQAFTGYLGEKFDARAVADRSEWGFVYHLHGSVHYSLAGSSLRPNIVWKDDLSGKFEDSQPLMPSMAAEFRPVIPTTLVAGGFKLDQLLADPAQSFYASLVRHVQQADAFLIAGYGFGDVHVNRALQNRFAADPNGRRGRPQTIVATKTDHPFALIGDREGYEFLARELTRTLSTFFTTSQATPTPRLTIAELVQRSLFETDPFDRVQVWHGGFAEARDHLDRFVRTLQRP